MGPYNHQEERAYGVLAVDLFTKFAITAIISEATAENVANFILTQVFAIHGTPEHFITDNATCMTATKTRQVMATLGANKKWISIHRPQTNGQAERTIRTLKDIITLNRASWVDQMAIATFAYNTTPNHATGYSPYLMFGRKPRLPIDVVLGATGLDQSYQDYEDNQYAYTSDQKIKVR